MWDTAGVSARYPRFLGNGYVALSPLRGGGSGEDKQLTAVIVCRPETNNGLVLLNSDSVDVKHDFFAVALVDGRAVITYDNSHLKASFTSHELSTTKLRTVLLKCMCSVLNYLVRWSVYFNLNAFD